LEPYPQYASLHGLPLRVSIGEPQADWLAEHWEQHRVDLAGTASTAGRIDVVWPKGG
jgi:hypothetical protein